ncbi:MAG: glutamate racemase [Clostridia bacterium]|nr:glutamate racemase [Clostridia bacterium]
MTEYILIFDSGSGGKFVLNELKKVLPHENYIFFCDEKNCPYGNKKIKTLKSIVSKTLENLLKTNNIKLLIIACNTISSLFKDYLSLHFSNCPILFVEPELNEKILENKTLVIATSNTIKHSKIIHFYKGSPNLFLQGFGNLAIKIDKCNGDFGEIKSILTTQLSKFKNCKIKNVVLGCTHYNFIKKEIKEVLSNEIIFYENSKKIARKAKSTLKKMNRLN